MEDLKFNVESAGEYLIFGCSAACIAMLFFAGSQIVFAILTAGLATVSVIYLLFEARKSRMGARVWNWCMENPVTMDIILTVGFGLIFGVTTATGLLASGAAGVMTSAIIKLLKRYMPDGGIVDIPPKVAKQRRSVNANIYPAEYRTA